MSCMRLSQTPDKAFVPYVSWILFWRVLHHYQVLKCIDFCSPVSKNSTSNTPFLFPTTVAKLVPYTMCLLQLASLCTAVVPTIRKTISLEPHFSDRQTQGRRYGRGFGGGRSPTPNNMADPKVGNSELGKYELEKFTRVKFTTFKLATSRNRNCP